MAEREKHLLAGLDDRHRGFSRIAEIEPQEGGCTASFRYERMVIVGPLSGTAEKALADLVLMLHERGYTELRTRVTFRGERYLGSQEAWVEYPDIPSVHNLRKACWACCERCGGVDPHGADAGIMPARLRIAS